MQFHRNLKNKWNTGKKASIRNLQQSEYRVKNKNDQMIWDETEVRENCKEYFKGLYGMLGIY